MCRAAAANKTHSILVLVRLAVDWTHVLFTPVGYNLMVITFLTGFKSENFLWRSEVIVMSFIASPEDKVLIYESNTIYLR